MAAGAAASSVAAGAAVLRPFHLRHCNVGDEVENASSAFQCDLETQYSSLHTPILI